MASGITFGTSPLQAVVTESSIALEILKYLTQNPDAKDTVEGIAHWWLLDQKISSELARVRAALNELVEQGLLSERTGADSQTYYEVNRSNLSAVQARLKGRLL